MGQHRESIKSFESAHKKKYGSIHPQIKKKEEPSFLFEHLQPKSTLAPVAAASADDEEDELATKQGREAHKYFRTKSQVGAKNDLMNIYATRKSYRKDPTKINDS